MTVRVLVIDDLYATSARYRERLDELLASLDVAATYSAGQRRENGQAINNVEVALEAAASAGESAWALALVDMHFASGPLSAAGVPAGRAGDEQFGVQVEAALNARFPALPTVRFTDRHEGEIGSERRPFLSKHLLTAAGIAKCLVRYGRMPAAERRVLLGVPEDTVFESPGMFALYADARQAASVNGPVLLLGESGTGKEHLARFVHMQSPRAKLPFVGLNIASVPQDLIEAELFGAERGAYTGATASRPGFLDVAAGGTLFLDEIGDLPDHTQSKLLRVLQENEYYSVGSRTPKKLACGVIAATRRPIDQHVREGTFRDDLFYRFPVVLRIPPLRERREDIAPLAMHLLDQLSHAAHKEGVSFSEDALRALQADYLQGNVRELANLISRAVGSSSHRALIRAPDLRVGLPQLDDSPAPRQDPTEISTARPQGAGDLRRLLQLLECAELPADATLLRGILVEIEASFRGLRRHVALVALASCRHPVSGRLRIQPAMQLLTGDAAMTATNARRRLNDLLGRPQSTPLELAALEAEIAAASVPKKEHRQ